LQKLEIYYPFLLDQGLKWMDGLPFFMCNYPGCDPKKKLQALYSILEDHVKKIHFFSIRGTNTTFQHLSTQGYVFLKLFIVCNIVTDPNSIGKMNIKLKNKVGEMKKKFILL